MVLTLRLPLVLREYCTRQRFQVLSKCAACSDKGQQNEFTAD